MKCFPVNCLHAIESISSLKSINDELNAKLEITNLCAIESISSLKSINDDCVLY
jgi:hypothetical protein